MSPAPNRHHQRFGSQFVTDFTKAPENNSSNCNCDVLYETVWIVSEDTVVRPDVLITCENLAADAVTNPPSLILAILSPSTILKDRNTRFNLYQAYGVRYYLVAELGKKHIEIFHLKNNTYQEANDLKEFHLSKDGTVSFSVMDLFA